jgi:hypothetical protein
MGVEAAGPFGMATSVGPLPLDRVEDAVAFAVSAHGRFPTAPVLSGHHRSLLARAVHGLAGVEVLPPGLLRVERDRLPGPDEAERAAASLCGAPFDGLAAFLEALARGPASAPSGPHDGPVRVGLTGPVTLALALRAAGVPVAQAAAVARAAVCGQAVAVLALARRLLPSATVVVVLSEPGLVGGMHPTFPLTRGETRSLLEPVVDALDRSPAARAGLIIGVHVPGRTDWAAVLASGVSMVSAPADAHLAGWARELSGFLDAGGWVAWGAVPVDQPLGSSEERLWRRLSRVWGELSAAGVDPMLLRVRSMVSPADGLGHFGVPQACRVLDLTTALSVRLRRQTVSARMSLGA